MSFLVVIIVAVAVFLYLRMTRQARRRWLSQLNLPGDWRWRDGDARLRLNGQLDKGTFVLEEGESVWRGDWVLAGHELSLRGGERDERLDVYLFSPGQIGLEDDRGIRRVFTRDAGNVVQLRAGNRP